MPSHARLPHARRYLVQVNQRVSAMSLNKRLTAGIGAAVLLTGAATGTAVALTGSSGPSHTAAASSSAVAAARPSADTANRSEQRAPLTNASADAAKAKAAAEAKAKAAAAAAAAAKAKAEAQAKAQAAAKAKAEAAAQAQAQARARAQAQAAAQAKAQAQAQAAAQAKAAAAAAAAKAAATPVYANDLSGWIAQAQAILQADGDQVPTADAITARAMTESSGNPNAENNWDSNAAAGTPSIGLMQVIQPTFDTYALPGHTDIWNPVDNIVAAVRYANATYGSFMNIAYGTSGY
jgi:soluble lytic murein transglycosylase-like protein